MRGAPSVALGRTPSPNGSDALLHVTPIVGALPGRDKEWKSGRKAGRNRSQCASVARRAPEKPGTDVVFVTPIEGTAQVTAAKSAGFTETGSLNSVRIEGPDTPGLVAKLTRALADGGINLRGLSAAAIGGRMICHLRLDSAQDADKAIEILKRL